MSTWRPGPPWGDDQPDEPGDDDELPAQPFHDPEVEEDEEEDADHWANATEWPMTWRGLYPRERWMWFEQLWTDVCALRRRYRLAVRSGWWEDEVQLELLAAFAAWVQRYDNSEWTDPPGKLALLYDLERINALLRDGLSPFEPRRDHPAFLSHIISLGAKPPPGWGEDRR